MRDFSDVWSAAHHYAKCGLPVAPIKKFANEPAISDWQTAATTSKELIDHWFNPGGEFADEGVCIITGQKSGWWAIHATDHNLLLLERDHGDIERRATAKTVFRYQIGQGEIFTDPLDEILVFDYPADGRRIPSTQGLLAEGINVCGDGSFVRLPPTTNSDGQEYLWSFAEDDLDDLENVAPGWLLDLVCRVDDWAPRDLTAALRGQLTDLKPTIGETSTGEHLLYAGHLNGVHGESGIGKTMFAQAIVVEQLELGNQVVYLDLEDPDENRMCNRLQSLGATKEQLHNQLKYINPTTGFHDDAVGALVGLLTRTKATLCVLDSLGGAFAFEGINGNNDHEVAPFFKYKLEPLIKTGACVLLIDHSTKSNSNPLHASGSQRKRAAMTGASYQVKTEKAMSRTTPGTLALIVAKDREGQRTKGTKAATISFDSTFEEGRIIWSIDTPTPTTSGGGGGGSDGGDGGGGITELDVMAIAATTACEQYQTDHGAPPSQRQLIAAMKTKVSGDAKKLGIEHAIDQGSIRVETGPRNSNLHHFVRRFDPQP
jgi:hypothetical protein